MTPSEIRRQPWAYPVLLALMGLGLGVSGAPAPLYGLYAAEWDFPPITTTVIFAVYAIAALVSVLVTGSISDRYGRKPILVLANAGLAIGAGLFIVAQSVAGLLAARIVHGFSVGAIVVAGAAALLDLKPDQGARTGKRTGVAFNLGIAASIVGVSISAEYGSRPLVTPYVGLLAITLVLFVCIVAMREPHTPDRSVPLALTRPRVPVEIRADFRFAAVGVVASWSVLGVFLSLFPTIASHAAGTDSLLFGGAIVAIAAFAAALSQLVAVIWTPRTAAVAGDIGTAVFLVACIVVVRVGNGMAMFVVSAMLGFFFGLAFGSSLRHLGDVMPGTRRGEVMSAFYVFGYGALAVPTILAGWAATVWSPEAIFAPFLGCVAVASLVAGWLGWTLDAPDADIDLDD